MPKCSLFFLPHWVAVILTTHVSVILNGPRRIKTEELSTFVFRLHTVAFVGYQLDSHKQANIKTRASRRANITTSQKETQKATESVPVQHPVAYQESCKGKAGFCQKAVPWAGRLLSFRKKIVSKSPEPSSG